LCLGGTVPLKEALDRAGRNVEDEARVGTHNLDRPAAVKTRSGTASRVPGGHAMRGSGRVAAISSHTNWFAPHAAVRPLISQNDPSSLFVGACSLARSPAPVRFFGPPSRRGRAAESAGAIAAQSAAPNAAPIPAGRVTQQPREQRRRLALLLR
jgi:hypothetical protein